MTDVVLFERQECTGLLFNSYVMLFLYFSAKTRNPVGSRSHVTANSFRKKGCGACLMLSVKMLKQWRVYSHQIMGGFIYRYFMSGENHMISFFAVGAEGKGEGESPLAVSKFWQTTILLT